MSPATNYFLEASNFEYLVFGNSIDAGNPWKGSVSSQNWRGHDLSKDFLFEFSAVSTLHVHQQIDT